MQSRDQGKTEAAIQMFALINSKTTITLSQPRSAAVYSWIERLSPGSIPVAVFSYGQEVTIGIRSSNLIT